MTTEQLIKKLEQYPCDKEVLLYISPCGTQRDELSKCGAYCIMNIEEDSEFVIISNN